MFEKEIDELREQQADALTKKHEHREQWGISKSQLTVLMAIHKVKSSASFDNKIIELMQMPEIVDEVIKLEYSFTNDDIACKKWRDLADYFGASIMELQSRRKAENGIL